MPNQILAEHNDSNELTITLASLADGSARQSDMIDNTDNAQLLQIYFLMTTGTSPNANSTIEFYLLKGDDPTASGGSNIRTDNAGSSDAAITIDQAKLVEVVQVDGTNDKSYRGSFIIRNPGPEWGIAVKNNTGAALNSTGSNQSIRYVIENVEVQS